MSCFYYDKDADKFFPHKDEYKACIEEDHAKALVQFKQPFSLFIAMQAERLFADCLWQVFELSSHFSSKLKILSLRGFTEISSLSVKKILTACTEIAHLDLSYNKLVDDECVAFIGKQYRETMVSLILRSCHSLTDEGIIAMCENFSDARSHRTLYKDPENDDQRYKEINKVDLSSKIGFLNVGDIK